MVANTVLYNVSGAIPTTPVDDVQPVASTRVDRVSARLDMDALVESLADKLGEHMVGSPNVARLVTTRFDLHGEALQPGLVDAIVHGL